MSAMSDPKPPLRMRKGGFFRFASLSESPITLFQWMHRQS